MNTDNYWGNTNQPVKPYGGNWLSDFAQQTKPKIQDNAMQNYYQPQSMAGFDVRPSSQQPMQDNYQPQDLMQRYANDNKNYSASLHSQIQSATTGQAQGIVGGATNQIAAMMNPQPAYAPANNDPDSYQEPDDSFFDESGEEFKIKKPPKPAYDWSTDFG